MASVQLLNHFDPAVAAQILAVLRPAAAQEAAWLGLPAPEPEPFAGQALHAAPLAATDLEGGERSERTESDDLADITTSRHVHLGAWLSAEQARQAGVVDSRPLAAVLSLAPDPAPGCLCIALLVVAPWAQRRGLARALVQAALERGRGWGFTVTAARANAAALALYQGLGFVPGRTGLLGAARVPVVQLLCPPQPPPPSPPAPPSR